MKGEAGGAAVQVLGLSLSLLLLVIGLGLADAVRAATLRTQAARALTAATESAARSSDLQDRRSVAATFHRVLTANLGAAPRSASVMLVPSGGRDPVSGQVLDRPRLTAHLELEYRAQYLGRWLPPTVLRISHTALVARARRNPKP